MLFREQLLVVDSVVFMRRLRTLEDVGCLAGIVWKWLCLLGMQDGRRAPDFEGMVLYLWTDGGMERVTLPPHDGYIVILIL